MFGQARPAIKKDIIPALGHYLRNCYSKSKFYKSEFESLMTFQVLSAPDECCSCALGHVTGGAQAEAGTSLVVNDIKPEGSAFV